MGWIVVGDTPKYKDCLVMVTHSEDSAKKLAQQFNEDAEFRAKHRVEDHTNFRPKETEAKDEWWNDPFLAN